MSKRKQVRKNTATYNLTVSEVVDLAIQNHRSGNLQQAMTLYRKVLKVQPNNINALHLLGVIFAQQEDYTTATDLIKQAIHHNNTVPIFYQSLGNVLRGQGKSDEAIVQYRQALTLDPKHVISHQNLLITLNCVGNVDLATIFAEHQRFDQQHALPLTAQAHQNDRTRERRLKIGYVSPDFWNHAVAHFIEPILVHHNREQFEIYCYYNRAERDEFTQRLQQQADQWVDCVTLTDEALSTRIRQDQIDILVDLTGHNTDNRLLVFTRKPAPIQATYLGYPSTTGLSAIDYRITDNYADPAPVADPYSVETLVRMPCSYFCYQPLKNSPAVNPLPALKNKYLTFGSFNNYSKVTTETVQLWAEVLKAIPTSKLLVKTKNFADKHIRQAFIERFAQLGIEANRLILIGYIRSAQGHLRTYQQVDLGLDTYPYNGATTTCEALWMGVPVVTLVGERHASRMGLSILSALNLSEFIATTPEAYVARCVEFANNINALKKWRQILRETMQQSSLLDAVTFTNHLEVAYQQMWYRYIQETT